MPFRVAQKTLERLEWPQVLEQLAGECRTPQAQLHLRAHEPADTPEVSETRETRQAGTGTPPFTDEAATTQAALHYPFEQTVSGSRERLAETSEARALLDSEQMPPLGGAMDLEATLRRAVRGGVLSPQELRNVATTLAVLHSTARYLATRSDTAPHLGALADAIEALPQLEKDIDRCIDPSGEVSDRASPGLATARGEVHALSTRLQKRLARYLQDANISPYLSDDFVTLRNDRYVLPVRAESRSRVKGIVHDASNTGTTLFIEPQEVVELNNRLKSAELEVERERQRVLRMLTDGVTAVREPLAAGLRTLGLIDLAFARGHLSRRMNACEPRVERDGVFELLQLRHPLLPPNEAIANDLRLGQSYRVLVLSGANAGGKTVAMKSLALAALFVRAGFHVPCEPGSRVALVDTVLADIGDDQDIKQSLSTFSGHMANLAEIIREGSPHLLAVIDEVGVGTDPGEGAALAQAILEALADAGACVVTTTHYNLLKEMAAIDERFCNASVEFDPETLAPTYKLHVGTPGASSATSVAARMGIPSSVLERANALLQREDRQLDRMLSELAANRATLETETREAASLRAESAAARDEYRSRLERLQERRDKLFDEMRGELDDAFKAAHDDIAGVIRDLQRGVNRGQASAQEAARARAKLKVLEERRETEELTARPEFDERPAALDWRNLKPGDAVVLPGGGTGVLESLPDRHGKVSVRAASARLVLPADRVRLPAVQEDAAPARRGQLPARPFSHATSDGGSPSGSPSGSHSESHSNLGSEMLGGGTLHCDLRGLRVSDALDRVAEILDDAAAGGSDAVELIHGSGTGALRKAVREYLAASPYVSSYRPGDRAGGDGVTLAMLRTPASG